MNMFGSKIKHEVKDLHFLCGCAGKLDPLGHISIFRELSCEYFLEKEKANPGFLRGKGEKRPAVKSIMILANQKAKEMKGPGARFRVWKSETEPLNESNWESALFHEYTNDEDKLKVVLERAVRTAFESAQKKLGIVVEGKDSSSSRKSPPNKPPKNQQRPQPPPSARIEADVREFVKQYNDSRDALDRLDYARGQQDIEEWAKEIYVTLRQNPFKEPARQYNEDRRALLKVLYGLVNKWAEYNYSVEFESAIHHEFQERRLIAILSVCLPLDRAQSLYRLRCGTDLNYGIPWWCEFHCQPGNPYAHDNAQDQQAWIRHIDGHLSEPTMNKRLFRLLYSDVLNLQRHPDLKKWSRPAGVPAREETLPGNNENGDRSASNNENVPRNRSDGDDRKQSAKKRRIATTTTNHHNGEGVPEQSISPDPFDQFGLGWNDQESDDVFIRHVMEAVGMDFNP